MTTDAQDDLEQTARLLREWIETHRLVIENQRAQADQLLALTHEIAELRSRMTAFSDDSEVRIRLLQSIDGSLAKMGHAGGDPW